MSSDDNIRCMHNDEVANGAMDRSFSLPQSRSYEDSFADVSGGNDASAGRGNVTRKQSVSNPQSYEDSPTDVSGGNNASAGRGNVTRERSFSNPQSYEDSPAPDEGDEEDDEDGNEQSDDQQERSFSNPQSYEDSPTDVSGGKNASAGRGNVSRERSFSNPQSYEDSPAPDEGDEEDDEDGNEQSDDQQDPHQKTIGQKWRVLMDGCYKADQNLKLTNESITDFVDLVTFAFSHGLDGYKYTDSLLVEFHKCVPEDGEDPDFSLLRNSLEDYKWSNRSAATPADKEARERRTNTVGNYCRVLLNKFVKEFSQYATRIPTESLEQILKGSLNLGRKTSGAILPAKYNVAFRGMPFAGNTDAFVQGLFEKLRNEFSPGHPTLAMIIAFEQTPLFESSVPKSAKPWQKSENKTSEKYINLMQIQVAQASRNQSNPALTGSDNTRSHVLGGNTMTKQEDDKLKREFNTVKRQNDKLKGENDRLQGEFKRQNDRLQWEFKRQNDRLQGKYNKLQGEKDRLEGENAKLKAKLKRKRHEDKQHIRQHIRQHMRDVLNQELDNTDDDTDHASSQN